MVTFNFTHPYWSEYTSGSLNAKSVLCVFFFILLYVLKVRFQDQMHQINS